MKVVDSTLKMLRNACSPHVLRAARAFQRGNTELTLFSRHRNNDGSTSHDRHHPKTIAPKRPTIICCGGVAAVMMNRVSPPGHDTEVFEPDLREIIGPIRMIQTLFGGAKAQDDPQCVQIYGIGTTSLSNNKWNIRLTNRYRSWAGADALEFSEKIMLPLISDDYSITRSGTVKGVPLSMDEAIERLSMLTLYGHSYGTSFFKQVGNTTRRHMEELGLSKEQRVQLLNAVVSIGTGPVTNTIGQGHDPFNSILFVNAADSAVRQRVDGFDGIVPPDLTKFSPVVVHTDDNTAIIWSKPIHGEYNYIDCNGERKTIYDQHQLPAYASFSIQDLTRELMLRSVLTNAITRKGPISPAELIDPKILPIPEKEEEKDTSSTLPHRPTRSLTDPSTLMAVKEAIRMSKIIESHLR